MSLSKTFSNIAKNGTNALNATASFIEGQIDKKHKEEFNDKLSAKPRKKFGGKIMTDSELEQQKNEIEKWKKIANRADEFAKKNKLSTTEQQESSEEKNIKPNAKKKKQNNLRELQSIFQRRSKPETKKIMSKAKSKFNEYVKAANLKKIVNKAEKNGMNMGFAYTDNGRWFYYGLFQEGQQHGVGVKIAIENDKLMVLDDKLLMFKQGTLINADALNTTNLGGFVMKGSNEARRANINYGKNIKSVELDASSDAISRTVNNTFIDAKNNSEIEAYVIGVDMHGEKNGVIIDSGDLILKTIKSFDEMHKKGIKIDKPCLIIKNSCYDARKRFDGKSEDDIYDNLCKKVSNCTNKNTICVYYNSKSTPHWAHANIFQDNFNYAYDLYKDGKIIQKNITASKMNKYMDDILNNGEWDVPENKTQYESFMEKLMEGKENSDSTEPTFKDYAIGFGALATPIIAAAFVLLYLNSRNHHEELELHNSQNNNSQTDRKNNQSVEASQGQNSEREYMPNKHQSNTQVQIKQDAKKDIDNQKIKFDNNKKNIDNTTSSCGDDKFKNLKQATSTIDQDLSF